MRDSCAIGRYDGSTVAHPNGISDGSRIAARSLPASPVGSSAAGIPIVMAVESDRSLLVPGAYAFIAIAPSANGKLTATRLQVAKDGVRVNCVNPGATETQLTPAFRELVGPAMYDWGVAQIGRHGTPDDIAQVIEYLAIGACRWLNGVEIVVDGGYISGLIGGWVNLDASPNAQKPR